MSCENCATLEARIAELEAENAELRAALDSKNALLHRYGEPINTASSMVNLYIGTAIGIALAGPENVSKAQILGIAERLSAAWTVLDFEIARANRAGLVIHWQDTTGAQATYAILKDWYATPDPAALRHVIAEHSDFADLIEARQLGPGRKRDPEGQHVGAILKGFVEQGMQYREALLALKTQDADLYNRTFTHRTAKQRVTYARKLVERVTK